MNRLVLLLIACIFCFSCLASGVSGLGDLSGNRPNGNTATKLQQAWLYFHERDLCQEADVVFVFGKSGLEAWSRIESDRSLQKFRELFEPLKNSFSVELYTTRPPAEKRQDGEDDPPPSLWQNFELRSNLGDRVAFAVKSMVLKEHFELDSSPSDSLLKQRLLIYSEQTLNWNKRMERYALDLKDLTRFAYDPGVSQDMRSRAISVCAAHAQNLGKFIGKLSTNLALAFPVPEKQKALSPQPEISVDSGKSPAERAEEISAVTQGVSHRVYCFIHPEHYTVELDELRHPSLLDSLASLRQMVSDYGKSLSKPIRKQ